MITKIIQEEKIQKAKKYVEKGEGFYRDACLTRTATH